MILKQDTSTKIALNVTRTLVTVLGFNLMVIAFMFSNVVTVDASADRDTIANLTSNAALFVGFCLTLLGVLWLLSSQNWDAKGLCRPFPFTMGSITAYLAVSQTVTAFMHEHLLKLKSAADAAQPGVAVSGTWSHAGFDALGRIPLLFLLVMGGTMWVLVTYAGPLFAGLKSPIRRSRGWVFAGYYFALQVPIYWLYARAWKLQYVSEDQPTHMLNLFAVQFFQPLLWFQ